LRLGELVTMRAWPKSSDSRTSTAFPASSPNPRSEVSSATPWLWSSPSAGAEKNALWRLRTSLPHLLRQAAAPRPRLVLWRQTGLSRLPGAQGRLLPVRWREARTARLACRQPPVHQAVRLLRGPALPRNHGEGGGRGTAPRLAYRQGAGQAVHAGATPASRQPRAAGHWYRRDRHRQGASVPHRGQRPGTGPPHLVRR